MNFDFITGEVLARAAFPAAIVVVVGAVWARVRGDARVLPIGGVLILGLSAVAYGGSDVLYPRAWVGVALAMAGAALARGAWPIVHAAAIIPGVLVSLSGLEPDVDTWMKVVAVVAIAGAGAGAERLERRHRSSSVVFVMAVGTIGGAWLTIPETDAYTFLMMLSAPLLLIAWPRQLVSLGPGGGAAVMSLVAVVGLEGATARSGSVVGGMFACGLLLIGLADLRFATIDTNRWTADAYRFVGLHAALVFAVVRVAGLREGAVAAALLAALAFGAAVAGVFRWLPTQRDSAVTTP